VSETEPTARLFFALWPDEAMQAALAASVSALVDLTNGRAVPASNFHLTLAFLGSVALSRMASLHDIAARCAASCQTSALPLVVTLDTFEYWRRQRILCATASVTPPAAVALARTLKRALTAGGFAPDVKPFRAHATFARKVHGAEDRLQATPIRWSFEHLHLVESETHTEGSIYRTVASWRLGTVSARA